MTVEKTDLDGFTVVKQKKGKKKSRHFKATDSRNTQISEPTTSIDIQSTYDKISVVKNELITSEFMSKVVSCQMLENTDFEEIYCFGLGQLSSVIARYQAAFLIILKEKLKIKDEASFVFDPVFCHDEKILLQKLGFCVLNENTQCRNVFTKKSLVILPHCPKELTNNILYANYKAKTEKNFILISNSISNVVLRTNRQEMRELCQIIESVHKSDLVIEQPITNDFKHDDIFNDLSFHKLQTCDESLVDDMKEPEYGQSKSELL